MRLLAAVLSCVLASPCLLAQGGKPPDSTPPRAVVVKPAAPPASAQESRVALVIGNGAYRDSPLKNPVNDARAMSRALRACGFQVIVLENASYQKMREGLRDFGGRIAQGGVGLFFFAGHGMQVKGKNYLIPVGADIKAEDEVAGEAMDVDLVLSKLETARNRLNILVLDACRNNPFARSFRGSQAGLAPLDAPMGTYIAFATAPGRIAADGNGTNGLFTEQLLKAMRTPGLKLEETFKLVLTGVRKDSRDQQVPWTASSVEGDFYFVPGSAPATAGDPTAADLALWNAIKDTGTREAFEAYLDRFPGGIFAKSAATRLAELKAKEGAELPRPGKNAQGMLGVAIQDLDANLVKQFSLADSHGALVASVLSGSPADQAGLQVGDVITGLDGHGIQNGKELVNRVGGTAPGSTVKVELIRGGKPLAVLATLGEAADGAPGSAPERMDRLGFSVQPLTPDLAQRQGLAGKTGLLVSAVDQGSPAAQAGLQEGDLILEVNRRRVTRAGELQDARAEDPKQEGVLLLVQRGTTSRFVR
jgi:hypothetical protein